MNTITSLLNVTQFKQFQITSRENGIYPSWLKSLTLRLSASHSENIVPEDPPYYWWQIQDKIRMIQGISPRDICYN